VENKITKIDNTLIADSTYKQLLSEIGQVIAEGGKQVLKAVNTTMLLMQKLNYIHQNPVRAEIVAKPEDYLYSSALNYAGEKGLLNVELIR
jgi:hypothetical protein